MRALCCALLCLVALGATPSEANRLDPFIPLVGGSWVGGGFLPGIGNYKSTRTFGWTPDGRLIETKHVLTIGDSVHSETAYLGWDERRSTVALWGVASDGSQLTARQVPARGKAILIDGTTVGAAQTHWRMMLRLRGDHELSILVEHERKGSWIPYTSALYRREKR